MSPAKKKTAAKKKTTKKTAARKAPARKAAVKKKATAKKPAAKKAQAKKATKKKATAKKATKKKAGKKKKVEEPAPVRPKNPGKLVVARGKQVSKLGDRWTCWGCEAVFYDLNQPKPTCPKCGQDQTAKQGSGSEKKKKKKPSRRDSMRALRILDDDDGPPAAEADSGTVEMDLEAGSQEKLLEQADKVAETDED